MYSKNVGGRASDKVWITIWGKYLPCFWSQPQPPRRDYGLGSGSPQGICVDTNLPGEDIPVPMKSLGGPKGRPIPHPSLWQFSATASCPSVKWGSWEVQVIVPGLLGKDEPM